MGRVNGLFASGPQRAGESMAPASIDVTFRQLPVLKTVSGFVSGGVPRPPALVAYKATADAVSKSVTLAVTVAAARVFSPETFGVFALAMTTGWLLGVVSDAGLSMYLARAVARRDGAIGPITRDVMRARSGFAAVAFGGGAAAAAAWVPHEDALAFALVVLAQLTAAVFDTLSHVYRGLGRSEIESRLTIGYRLLTAALALGIVAWRPTLLLLGLALAVPPACALVASTVIHRRLARSERPRAAATAPRSSLAHIVREAAPIGAGIVLSALYFRCDIYFVGYWHGLQTVGQYNAVFRLVEALRLLPAAVLAVRFPDLCRAADASAVRRLSLGLVSGGAVALAATWIAAAAVVRLAYGEAYLPAVPALRILSLALPLFFLNYALTHQVIAWDRQTRYASITGVALVANLAANVLLIPSGGMIGAAWATLITEIVVTLGCAMALRSGPRKASGVLLGEPTPSLGAP